VLFDRSVKQYTFQSKAEYEEFKAGAAEPFEWIDWGYRDCFQMQAFVRSERNDFEGALRILEQVKQLAPISAGTAVEMGYAFNQLRRFREALDSHMRAEALAGKYPSQRPHLSLALRGKGFALIELQRLDEAEVAFKSSLEIEPNNKLALNELGYIKRLRGAN
jgi:Flp pilus assembly protein TadD